MAPDQPYWQPPTAESWARWTWDRWTTPRCEKWAHTGGRHGERCQQEIVGTDGKLWPCLSRIVSPMERAREQERALAAQSGDTDSGVSGYPTPRKVSGNPQVRGGRNRLSQAERSRRARVRKLERAIDRGLKS
jgi:hypothetical protein